MLQSLLFPPVRLDPALLRARMTDRRVLITGGSRGIGAATAKLLGAAGAHVILVARDATRLDAVADDITTRGGSSSAVPTDLRDPDQVDALLGHPVLESGLDVLVSNAGISIHRCLSDSLERPDDLQRTIAVNHLAPARLVLGVTSALARSHGLVVNVSALNVLLPPAPEWAAYQASKSAFDQWLRSTAPELESLGVRVRSIYLPLVRTDMIAPNPAYRNAPAMSAERAANLVGQAIIGRRRRYQPWWSTPATGLSTVLRGPTEAAYRIQLRKRSRREPPEVR